MKTTYALATVLVVSLSVAAEPPSDYERFVTHPDGNRSLPVHRIHLYDEFDETISPYDSFPRPFSTRVTCGKCHDYDRISTGWHFNSARPGAEPGRPGEPWFFVNEETGTQLPVSNRDWPGTWKPEQLGLTPWQFTKEFGRHMPGGDMGEVEEDPPDVDARWEVSGRLEIDCLMCHNAETIQNGSERAIQIARENLRWAAAAASGLGIVDGLAANLPETYNLIDGPNPDNAWATPPEVTYDKTRFDPDNRVFFDLDRKPGLNRCYFCHSMWRANDDAPESWVEDGDVHVARGMACADCHRNSLSHDIVRGYEGESEEPGKATLTCRGCHMGTHYGRFAAPHSMHKGMPASHIEKISCTACHSGPWPGPETETVRTSRANRLGIHGRAQWFTEAPYITAPVFLKQTDGTIGMHAMMWPAFWGTVEGDAVNPLQHDVVKGAVRGMLEAEAAARREAEEAAKAAQKAAEEETEEEAEETEAAPVPEPAPEPERDRRLTKQQIAAVLARLAQDGVSEPAYVCNGRCYRLGGSGVLVESVHSAGNPYTWPLGHDVRPAAQSLGAGGCQDCHASDAPFFFAQVVTGSPVQVNAPATVAMHELQGLDPKDLDFIALSVRWRPWFVGAAVALAGLLAFALARYIVLALEAVFRATVAPRPKKDG